MCSPDHFDVVYEINPWMHIDSPPSKKKSRTQWAHLVSVLKKLGAEIYIIDPVIGLPDMVFAANGSCAIGKKAIISKFRYQERQGESEHYRAWHKSHGYGIVETDGISYEGQGDTLLFKDTIFQGWGFRSDKKISIVMQKAFPKKKVVPLQLVDNRFYHMDICLFPADHSVLFYYPQAFSKESVKQIKSVAPTAVAVSEEETLSFGLNAIYVNKTIVLPSSAKRFAKRLLKAGFKTLPVDMSEFIKSGGAVKCCINALW